MWIAPTIESGKISSGWRLHHGPFTNNILLGVISCVHTVRFYSEIQKIFLLNILSKIFEDNFLKCIDGLWFENFGLSIFDYLGDWLQQCIVSSSSAPAVHNPLYLQTSDKLKKMVITIKKGSTKVAAILWIGNLQTYSHLTTWQLNSKP